MKNFVSEFKKFITRGNVVDMAVGVIVGGAFTAIVNGMSNFILKPLTNWLLAIIFGADSLKDLYTMLKPAYVDVVDPVTGVSTLQLDLTHSIYIDWGSFINAVISFFLIALVLFTIVKILNKLREEHEEFEDKAKICKADRKEMKKQGIKRSDKAAIEAYFAEKKRVAEEVAKAQAEKARLEREANPTTEDLLKQILAELQKNA